MYYKSHYNQRRSRPGAATLLAGVMVAAATVIVTSGCREQAGPAVIRVEANRAAGGREFRAAAPVRPFVGGVMLHNGFPVMTADEFEEGQGAGVMLVDPETGEFIRIGGGEVGPGNVRCLERQEGKDGPVLWIGSWFDGAYQVKVPSGEIIAHLTVESTGLIGRAIKIAPDRLTFHPDAAVSPETIADLQSRVPTGLYLRLNTESFQVKRLSWPEFEVYTYEGNHDLPHAGRAAAGLDRVVIMSGLPDNSVNDILVEGDTVWLATGVLGDKGLAGGVVAFRNGKFFSRYPDAVFNLKHKFHWQRSNAALSLCRQAGRLWSGWAEIRGMKPWGGVSGNLLSFSGRGESADEWKDFTRPIGVNAEGWAEVLHTSVTSLAPVSLNHGRTAEACVAAATLGMNNPLKGMGWPPRLAGGGGGLRLICDRGLVGLVAKSFVQDRPRPGSPSSNLVLSVAVGVVKETKSPYAVAGTDAGLYVAELSSQVRQYFYQTPPHPAAAINIGSNYLRGVRRAGEVLHGMTVGGPSWPACLPDLMAQAVYLEGELSAETTSAIWVGTYGGLARYRGPIQDHALKDCRRWQWYCLEERSGFKKCSEADRRSSAPVSAVLPMELAGKKWLAIGTGTQLFAPGQGEALKRAAREAQKDFLQRPLTQARLLYSTFYEDPEESLIFPDSAALNVYTEKFHASAANIAEPSGLVGDTSLNWAHLDAMTDALLARDLVPTFCPSTFPSLLYRDFLAGPDKKCSPPDPNDPECAPSRTAWDFRRWENLTFALVDHWYRRYGRARVSGWTLEVWNEPALVWLWPWNRSWAQDYAVLYEHTRSAVDAGNAWWDEHEPAERGKSIRLAGPAWHGDTSLSDARLGQAITELERRHQRPDLLTLHLYPFVSMDLSPWYNRAVEILRKSGAAGPVAVTEYGPVMAQSYDGIGTSAASEVPALFLLQSMRGLYAATPPPEIMDFLDIQSIAAGSRSNWPGLVGYLGNRDSAPRPLFNLLTLAAQAGEIPLLVQSQGDVAAFGNYEPRTGKIMLFAYRTRLGKPWKETVNYSERGEREVALSIQGLPQSFYRSREFKIDGGHANLLTALWRAGSPDQPTPAEVEQIKRESGLAPLAKAERSLPETIRGSSAQVQVRMEDESIYVAELTPPPALAVSGSAITDLAIAVTGGGDLAVRWSEGPLLYRREYEMERRAWGESKAETNPSPAVAGGLPTASSPGELSIKFNGKETKYNFQQAGTENMDWDGKNLAYISDGEGALHLVYGAKGGGLWYEKYFPIMERRDKKIIAAGIIWVRSQRIPISSYPPFPASDPQSPAVAVDGRGDAHIVWIERNAKALGVAGKEAVVYGYLRK